MLAIYSLTPKIIPWTSNNDNLPEMVNSIADNNNYQTSIKTTGVKIT